MMMFRPYGREEGTTSAVSLSTILLCLMLVAGAGVLVWRWWNSSPPAKESEEKGRDSGESAKRVHFTERGTEDQKLRHHSLPEVVHVEHQAALQSIVRGAKEPDFPWRWCEVTPHGEKDTSMWKLVGYLEGKASPWWMLLWECDTWAYDASNPPIFHYLVQEPSSHEVHDFLADATQPLMSKEVITRNGTEWTVSRIV